MVNNRAVRIKLQILDKSYNFLCFQAQKAWKVIDPYSLITINSTSDDDVNHLFYVSIVYT